MWGRGLVENVEIPSYGGIAQKTSCDILVSLLKLMRIDMRTAAYAATGIWADMYILAT